MYRVSKRNAARKKGGKLNNSQAVSVAASRAALGQFLSISCEAYILLTLFLVACTWNNWGSWGSCSQTCGSGSKTRSRSKNEPSCGGSDCLGLATSTTSCNTNICPDPGDKIIKIFEGGSNYCYLQLTALGVAGDHLGHVQLHAAKGAAGLVQGQK